MKATKTKKVKVRILGEEVTVGTKRHAALVSEKRHLDDLSNSEQNYKGFTLQTIVSDCESETIAFDSTGRPVAGTASHLDKLSSVEKMKIKLDKIINN